MMLGAALLLGPQSLDEAYPPLNQMVESGYRLRESLQSQVEEAGTPAASPATSRSAAAV